MVLIRIRSQKLHIFILFDNTTTINVNKEQAYSARNFGTRETSRTDRSQFRSVSSNRKLPPTEKATRAERRRGVQSFFCSDPSHVQATELIKCVKRKGWQQCRSLSGVIIHAYLRSASKRSILSQHSQDTAILSTIFIFHCQQRRLEKERWT